MKIKKIHNKKDHNNSTDKHKRTSTDKWILLIKLSETVHEVSRGKEITVNDFLITQIVNDFWRTQKDKGTSFF